MMQSYFRRLCYLVISMAVFTAACSSKKPPLIMTDAPPETRPTSTSETATSTVSGQQTVSTSPATGHTVTLSTTHGKTTAAKPSATSTHPPTKKPTASSSPVVVKPVKQPVASGKVVYTENGCLIDASHISQGYIMAKYTGGGQKRIKLQIKADSTYNYDLNLHGDFEVFPLQMGNGSYTIRFMQNTSGSKYRQIFAKTISVSLENDWIPFLYPNQYVNYTQNSTTVKKSFELCANTSSDLEKVAAIYAYVTDNIRYDYQKAATVKAGYLPNTDKTLSEKKGICFDYASLVAAMLRAQGIPTRLVIGEVKSYNSSHAWNLIYVKNKGWIAVKIAFQSNKWNLTDATFGSFDGSEILSYITNSSNYTAMRWY